MTIVSKIRPYQNSFGSHQVYCGRAGKGQNGKWGNPEPLRNEEDRLNNIERFHHRLFTGDLQSRLENLEELKDKELMCFCCDDLAKNPKNKACHCHVYADIVNQIWG